MSLSSRSMNCRRSRPAAASDLLALARPSDISPCSSKSFALRSCRSEKLERRRIHWSSPRTMPASFDIAVPPAWTEASGVPFGRSSPGRT